MSAPVFCSTCGHSLTLHHHPAVAVGRPCSLDGCECLRFEKGLAINTPTAAEQRWKIRMLKEQLAAQTEPVRA